MLKVGILGTGFGREHARLFQINKNVEIAGIYGRNKEQLNSIEKDMGIKPISDSSELLDDPSVDLIDVCLPTNMHHEYVMSALKKGKHVFCEITMHQAIDSLRVALATRESLEKGNKVILL